jgi:hypothetical protein
MARTERDGQGTRGEPIKVVIRKRTLRQVVGSGGGIAPSVAAAIGNTDKGTDRGEKARKPGKHGDYRDYLRG